VKVSNGTAGKPPLPGDVVSFDNSNDPAGHAGVIASGSVDASGNGSVRMMSQNDTSDGWRTLAVSNWRLASFGGFIPYGWLHDPSGSGTTDRPPYGAVTKAAGSSGHKVRVKGWTIDPDTPTTPTKVVAFVSGSKPSAFRIRIDGLANLYRADVASAYPKAGPYHGFDLHTTVQRAQTVTVSVYAVDTSGGPRALIGSRSVSVP
jgi:hypothetical protein